MRKKIESLEQRQSNFELNLKEKLKQELKQEFGTMVQEFKKEVTATFEQCQSIATKMEQSINTFESNLIEREERMNKSNL